jgi:4'-phosphopantetheinyl transferase
MCRKPRKNAFGLMHDSITWSAPPQLLSVQSGEVHIWRVELDQPADRVEKFRSTLAVDEIERAHRFHFEIHRKHFLVGRGFLRYVIARYLGSDAAALQFSYGPFGKPALSGAHEDSGLRFNMSHSHNVGLVAITDTRELGVDVEHIRADFASEEIARRFFSPREVETFNSLAEQEQVAAFFRCWSRKESYIKAIGRGLSQPLDAFDVTLAPGERAALLRAEGDDATRWAMSDIDAGAEYAAALAVEGPLEAIRYWATDLHE